MSALLLSCLSCVYAMETNTGTEQTTVPEPTNSEDYLNQDTSPITKITPEVDHSIQKPTSKEGPSFLSQIQKKDFKPLKPAPLTQRNLVNPIDELKSGKIKPLRKVEADTAHPMQRAKKEKPLTLQEQIEQQIREQKYKPLKAPDPRPRPQLPQTTTDDSLQSALQNSFAARSKVFHPTEESDSSSNNDFEQDWSDSEH